MRHNTQVPEPRALGDGQTLEVHSIFYTIQGEGPYSGVPAVFIRLAGCNLQCPGCDTEYTASRESTPVETIYERAQALFPTTCVMPQLVVITGGEPLRQNISGLCALLFRGGALVQIETNGTFGLPPEFPKGVRIVCSPKAGKIASALLPHISCYKYVLDAHDVSTADGLPTRILGRGMAPARPPKGFPGAIYVSPMDVQNAEGNELNVQTTVNVCLRYGYILNLQVHKIVNLP